jgi:hypothetical protein
MPRGVWVRDPDRGGTPIPKVVQERTAQRLQAYAERHFTGRYTRLGIRFQKQFCYIDAFTEPEVPEQWPPPELPDLHETREERVERLRNTPTHLCRLRYFGDENRWSFAMFGYGNEKYELTILASGDFFGTPEEAFSAAAGASLG